MNKRMNALSLAVTVAILPAAAQQQAVEKGERIEITGSNIKRIEGETALPVTVISRAQLEQQGIQTAAEAVDRLSSNSSIGGVNFAGSIGATAVGFQSASLRGLGGTRTLVLMNGRRLANTAFQGGMVDLNTIPLSAIDRFSRGLDALLLELRARDHRDRERGLAFEMLDVRAGDFDPLALHRLLLRQRRRHHDRDCAAQRRAHDSFQLDVHGFPFV